MWGLWKIIGKKGNRLKELINTGINRHRFFIVTLLTIFLDIKNLVVTTGVDCI